MSPKKTTSNDLPRIGVDYTVIHDRILEDPRFEREKRSSQHQNQSLSSTSTSKSGSTANIPSGNVSSTFDAFIRLQAGIEGRSLSQKIGDSNRPTWESYKKENEEKLDIVGNEVKKMIEYRQQLDAEREARLSGLKRTKSSNVGISESDSDETSSDTEEIHESRSKKEKSKKEKSKKHKKEKKKHKSKKEKKERRSNNNDSSDNEDDNNDSR